MTDTRTRDFAGRSLLAVFAHPDDESIASGGLLALCADRGARVSILCLTQGTLGSGEPSPTLGHTRADELRAAAARLGTDTPIVLDHEDGMLPWTDPATLEADIRLALTRLRPDVVVTFGEDGLYWHPDHVAVHERTTAVVANLESPPSLYYVTVPGGRMRELVDHVADRQATTGPLRILGVDNVDAFGAMAGAPTLVVNVGGVAGRKLAAVRCHASQLQHDALTLLEEREAERFLGTEYYRRAEVGCQSRSFIEQLASQ